MVVVPRGVITLLSVLASAGCSYQGSARDFDPVELHQEPGWIHVDGVPLVRQEGELDCGAAALAMELLFWGEPASLAGVLEVCPPNPGRGIEAGALRAYARRRGLQAFLFRGGFADLERELAGGRPVLTGLLKRHRSGGLTHFEVVVAVHPERQIVVTLDPAQGWRQNTYAGFISEWEPSGRLLLLLFREDPRPGYPTAERPGRFSKDAPPTDIGG